MFRIGQKVVCIQAENPLTAGMAWNRACDIPQIGTVYTVRGLGQQYGLPALRLHEIIWRGWVEGGVYSHDGFYWAGRFRPVVEKKTDIGVFEEILKRETVDDRAPAHSS